MNHFVLKHYYFHLLGDCKWHQIDLLDSTFCKFVAKDLAFSSRRIENSFYLSVLDQPTTERLIHVFVSSKLDYCNSLLHGLLDKKILKLQRVQNAAARLVTKTRRVDHITQILRRLHWLPLRKRSILKILLITYKVLNELINLHQPSRHLRSNANDHLRLLKPMFRTKNYGVALFSLAE